MNLLQAIHILRDAFQARMLPFFHETSLDALYHLYPKDYPVYAVIAGMGALLASVSLYAIGVWLRRMPAKISTPEQQSRIELIRVVADEWLFWALILAPSPVGTLLIISAGFFGIKPAKAALMIVFAEIAWRLSPLISSSI